MKTSMKPLVPTKLTLRHFLNLFCTRVLHSNSSKIIPKQGPVMGKGWGMHHPSSPPSEFETSMLRFWKITSLPKFEFKSSCLWSFYQPRRAVACQTSITTWSHKITKISNLIPKKLQFLIVLMHKLSNFACPGQVLIYCCFYNFQGSCPLAKCSGKVTPIAEKSTCPRQLDGEFFRTLVTEVYSNYSVTYD